MVERAAHDSLMAQRGCYYAFVQGEPAERMRRCPRYETIALLAGRTRIVAPRDPTEA